MAKGYAASSAFLNTRQAATRREVVSVGWDGASRPMLRYRDELHLPDHARSIVSPADRAEREPAAYRGSRHEEIEAAIGEALHANIIGANRNG